MAAALGELARARGMNEVARAAGLGRESLYKALSAGGNPELGTVLRVIAALGLELRVAPRSWRQGTGAAEAGTDRRRSRER